MKIISKFHDYYDSASIFYDPTVIFKRETKLLSLKDLNLTLPFKDFSGLMSKNDRNIIEKMDASVRFLYFCGKIYPLYVLEKYILILEEQNGVFKRFPKFYTKFNDKSYSKSLEDLIVEASKENLKKHYNFNSEYKEIEYNLEKIKGYEVNPDIFRAVGSPYFITHGSSVIINPVLNELTKNLKMDASFIYQEIEMYMSGVLGSVEKKPLEISDKDKRDSKGFDDYSFKKRKK